MAVWPRRNELHEMQFAVRATSMNRGWSGFEAALYDTSSGFMEHTKMASHNVFSMQVGSPVVMTARCEGPSERRVQLPGEIDFMPLGCSATWENEGPTGFLCICFDDSLIRSSAEAMGLNADRLAFSPQVRIKDPRLEHVGWALKAELEAQDPCDRLYAESLGAALAVRLLWRFGRARRDEPEGGLTRRQLHAVTDYIEEHLAADLTLHELASIAGVSPSYFTKLFKESTGMSPHRFVIQRRVQGAADMLARGTLALSEVALLVGFTDQSHMARWMRRVLGVTPGTLQRQYR